jgi:hypothetical protein
MEENNFGDFEIGKLEVEIWKLDALPSPTPDQVKRRHAMTVALDRRKQVAQGK